MGPARFHCATLLYMITKHIWCNFVKVQLHVFGTNASNLKCLFTRLHIAQQRITVFIGISISRVLVCRNVETCTIVCNACFNRLFFSFSL